MVLCEPETERGKFMLDRAARAHPRLYSFDFLLCRVTHNKYYVSITLAHFKITSYHHSGKFSYILILYWPERKTIFLSLTVLCTYSELVGNSCFLYKSQNGITRKYYLAGELKKQLGTLKSHKLLFLKIRKAIKSTLN